MAVHHSALWKQAFSLWVNELLLSFQLFDGLDDLLLALLDLPPLLLYCFLFLMKFDTTFSDSTGLVFECLFSLCKISCLLLKVNISLIQLGWCLITSIVKFLCVEIQFVSCILHFGKFLGEKLLSDLHLLVRAVEEFLALCTGGFSFTNFWNSLVSYSGLFIE